jgi:hypothetical protein
MKSEKLGRQTPKRQLAADIEASPLDLSCGSYNSTGDIVYIMHRVLHRETDRQQTDRAQTSPHETATQSQISSHSGSASSSVERLNHSGVQPP